MKRKNKTNNGTKKGAVIFYFCSELYKFKLFVSKRLNRLTKVCFRVRLIYNYFI